MSARKHMGAMSYDRAIPVRDRCCLRDDGLVVERMEGSAGDKKSPAQALGWGC